MSVGRITKLEFKSEEALKQAEITYDKIRDEAFPTLELVINIKTGATSVVSIALYPGLTVCSKQPAGSGKLSKNTR